MRRLKIGIFSICLILFACSNGKVKVENNQKKGNIMYEVSEKNLKLLYLMSEMRKDDNLVFSNTGIESVVELARLASSGNTKKQIEDNFGIFDKDLNSKAVNIYNFMVSNENNGSAITKKSFIDTIKNTKYIKADIFKIDKDNDSEKVAAAVNKKITEATNGQIQNAVSKDTYSDASFKAQFGNVIHFLANWAGRGPMPYNTNDQYFKNVDGENIVDSFVYTKTNDADLIENDTAIGIALPYKEDDERYKFVAMVTKDENYNLKSIKVDELYSYDGEYILDTSIPCFEIDMKLMLNEILKSMGLTDLFDGNKADLTNAFDIVNENVYVSSCTQQVKIKLNEFGTEASAYTDMMLNSGASMPEEKPKKKVRYVNITFNRPFFYMIYDSKMKMPLFMGEIKSLNDNGQKIGDYYKNINTIVDEIREVDEDAYTKGGKK